LRGLREIEILERAQDDIFNIIEYGAAEHGAATTRVFVGKIAERINWLAANPGLGPVHSELRGGIRSFRQARKFISGLSRRVPRNVTSATTGTAQTAIKYAPEIGSMIASEMPRAPDSAKA
jgi:plasmid stabilization system protein ParE